jgi:uncharacterized membrane protein
VATKDNLSKPKGMSVGSGYDSDSSARWAEGVARFFGTGRYLVTQTIVVIIWICLNATVWALQWDPYPFILLNLVFSTQAAYAAPLILLAQNRQADRDKQEVERDRETNSRALAETEFLAREIAAVRMLLETKADREDVTEPLLRLTATLERIHGINLSDDEDEAGYSAESNHQ